MGADILARLFARPHPVVSREPPISDTQAPLTSADETQNLAAVLKAAGFVEAEFWTRTLAEPCRRFAINPGKRLAAFAATIGHESAGGQILTESLNYSPAGLLKTWPSRFTQSLADSIGRKPGVPANQEAIANYVYASRMGNGGPASGDGWRYRGRGLVQLTGRDAYRQAGAALGLPLEDDPAMAARPDVAALVSAWTWGAWKGCNQLADAGNVEGWRRRINGGLIGLDDVRKRYLAALAANAA